MTLDASAVPWVRRAAWLVFGLGVLAFLVRGADGPADPYVASAVDTPAGTVVREVVEGFESVLFRITKGDGSFADLCALLADDDASRQRGMMERTDFAGHDGMVFRFDAPIDAEFYMYNTVLPLSIAWFDEQGGFVSATQMDPCPSTDSAQCQRYGAERPYLHALEVPKGRLGALGVGPGSTISFPEGRCR